MQLNKPAKRNRAYRSKFRLRTIFLILNLTILILPLGGVFFFRIYENELLRQTETELIAQAAFISALYKHEIAELKDDSTPYGKALRNYAPVIVDEKYTPIYPEIDLAKDPTLSPRPDAISVSAPADRLGLQAGKRIRAILADAQKTTLAGIRVLDFAGNVVSGQEDVGLSFAHIEEVQSALAGHYQSVIRERSKKLEAPALASISRGTGVRVFITYPIVKDSQLWGVVYLSRTPQNIIKHLYAEKNKVILAGLTILGITFFITLFTTYMVTRPINRLIERTKRVSSGETEMVEPLRRPATKEVELLADSFAAMTKTLNERAEYIREFATHVSHEFKTPLTSIQGATELLLEHIDDMEPAKRQRFLTNIMEDTDRLKRLVSRLLELARADSITPTNEYTKIVEILKKLQARYEEKLELEAHISPSLAVHMAADNLETVFTNLLDNAQQHEATKVTISSREQNGVIISVADNGKGISQANRDKIFTPFFTTEREVGGTGIGLGIVQSIMEAHGGHIQLGNSESGTVFELCF